MLRKSVVAIVVGLWMVGAAAVLPARAVCPDGTPGNDVIDCTTNPPAEGDVGADLGNDSVTIENGVTSGIVGGDLLPDGTGNIGDGGDDVIINNGTVTIGLGGDISSGDGGDDTLTNNGTINGYLSGDYSYGGDGGDDIITNNGTVGIDIDGDFQTDNGGDDTIINNGSVVGNVTGDGVSTNGGDDTIINNGSVTGDIEGDSVSNAGGNDSITNSGSIGGNIIGGDGNDTVTVIVGSDVGGTISGDAGTDTLTFSGSTSDEAGYNQIQALVGCNPCAGTVTLDGQSYTFNTFEQLVNLLTLISQQSSGPVQVSITFSRSDDRLNWMDVGAPIAVYCTDKRITVIDIATNSQGVGQFSIEQDAIAEASASSAILGSGQGNQLVQLADGSLLAVGPTLDGSKTYSFPFKADCSVIRNGQES